MKLTSLSISHFESTIIADSMRVNLRNLSQNCWLHWKAKYSTQLWEVGGREIFIVHLGYLFQEFRPKALKTVFSLCYNTCLRHQTEFVFKINIISTKHVPDHHHITYNIIFKLISSKDSFKSKGWVLEQHPGFHSSWVVGVCSLKQKE